MTRLLSHFLLSTCLAIAMVALPGCRDKELLPHTRLLDAERLIDIWQLDSAAVLLNHIAEAPLPTKADSALYALNYVRLMKMKGIILPNDSIAKVATDFFPKIGDVHRSMLAWYYRTCNLFDNSHYPEASAAAERIKTFAEVEENHLYLARYGDIKAHCAEFVGNNLKAARYFTYSFNQFKEHIPDNDNYLNFFFELARNSWLKAGRIDTALILSNEMKPVVMAQTDTNTVSKWISNHATMLLNNRVRDYEGARALYREMDSLGVGYWPHASNHLIAKALIRALADRDTTAWHEAMAYIDKYGPKDIAYGYFVNEMSPEDFFVESGRYPVRADYDDSDLLNEEYGATFSTPEPAEEINESAHSHLWTWVLVIAVILAAAGLIWAFRKKL